MIKSIPQHGQFEEKEDILTHDQFKEILRHRAASLKGAMFLDNGMTVCNCPRDQLSPGCQACKSGTWICVFPGFACNASCSFCPRLTTQNIERQMTGKQMAMLFALIARRADRIQGLSISGGELFYDNLQSAKKILRHVKIHHPHIYLWGYTNGIAATRESMQELRDIGLNEIRFNLAATDYRKDIINKIRDHAVRIFPWVTVEVPAYNKTLDYLIQNNGLKELSDIGVKQLNLAEIRVPCPPPDSNNVAPASRTFLGEHSLYEYINPFGSGYLSLTESRLITWDILDYAHENGFTIPINDCSQDAKTLQMVQRYTKGLFIIQTYANGPIEDLFLHQKRRNIKNAVLRAVAELSEMNPRLGAAAIVKLGDIYLLPFTRTGRIVRHLKRSSPKETSVHLQH
jgi:pyruvate formate-lyase activating enzyme-like uncharacterized protein